MRLSETQGTILTTIDAKSKISAGDLGLEIGIPAGPCARSLNSLEERGLVKSVEKNGVYLYSRTAEGGKIAKTID